MLLTPAAIPQTPQSTVFISHLTNSNACGNMKVKVRLTVSPFRPPFPPQSDVYPNGPCCLPPLPTHYPLFFALCFHTLTNCSSRNPFILITIRIARGCGGSLRFYLATRHSPLPLCFHQLAASLSSPKKSTPLQSSKSRLFFGNTRGGGVSLCASVLRSQPGGCVRISNSPLATSLLSGWVW